MEHIFDSHVHSSFSPDSRLSPQELIQDERPMIITDHYDLHERLGSPFIFDTDAYFASWLPVRSERLLVGIELGLRKDALAYDVADKPFDFVLGSVHAPFDRDDAYEFVDHALLNTFDEISFQRYYFEHVLRSIQARPEIDALAHLDYPMRYFQHFRREVLIDDCHDLITQVMQELVRSDIALELNTARATAQPFYEEWRRLFDMYKQAGGRFVTIGSDAHRPISLRRQFEDVIPFIRACGLDIVHFQKRQRMVAK